jgi:putative ABC transport system ATP-binding protein
MALIEGRGLRKTYSGEGTTVRAVDGVDLDIERGEFVAVMGPSGSGKSTLLHILGALDVPDEGSVSLNGNHLSSLNRAQLASIRRRDVGFVFQFFNLVPVLTVEENIRLPATLDGSDANDHVDALITKLGLEGRRHSLPAQLSGGEQQRAAIARALVNRPNVVFADEPTGNLDRRSGAEVMSLLCKLHDEGQTVVVVTHDPAIASFGHRVVFMQDGILIDSMVIDGDGDATPVLERLAAIGQ